uniref:Transmembrane protein 150C n=1 Tax=Nothobranchius kuhntae TaxID=321403 RepID=A0A1A8HML2_NOTKU
MRTFSLWALLPPIFSVGTAAGLWMVYFVALYNEKVVAMSSEYRGKNGSLYPPFISVTGNFPPASCFFSQVMNMGAFLGFVIGLLRYLQLKKKIEKPWLNDVSAAGFLMGCFGMTLVGNFQLFEEMLIHNIGTLMTFGLGTVYCWMQSYITLKVNLSNEGKAVAIIRFLLSAAITICVALKYALLLNPDRMHAARCQWALVMFFLAFFGTFSVEFRHFHVEMTVDTLEHPVSQFESSDVFRQHLEQL